MRSVFSPGSLKILESFSFTRTLYAFDFDGTLSPIVDEPELAAMKSETAELMSEIARRFPTAIISGRSLQDLRPRIPFKARFLIGNHGLEGLGDSRAALSEASRIRKAWLKELQRHLMPAALALGMKLEDKGFSLAIHYRKSRQKKLARKAIADAIRLLSPVPRIIPGKCVVNLIPPGAPHKGVALLELMKACGARAAFYIGDDDTDEDVFSLPDPGIFKVRVGRKRSSSARYYIARQSEMNRLLRNLLQFAETQE